MDRVYFCQQRGGTLSGDEFSAGHTVEGYPVHENCKIRHATSSVPFEQLKETLTRGFSREVKLLWEAYYAQEEAMDRRDNNQRTTTDRAMSVQDKVMSALEEKLKIV